MALSRDDRPGDLIQARSDLLDILGHDPENTGAIVTIIENELKDIKDKDVVAKITNALNEAASRANVEDEARDNVLHWLTETSPDVRQMIMVKTIEELLGSEQTHKTAIAALSKVSSKDNVDMVLKWVNRGILTLNQAVYVLLYPDSSGAFG